MSGPTASNLPDVCGVGAVTYAGDARKKEMQYRYRHAASTNWWMERNLTPPTIEAAGTSRKRGERESCRERPQIHREDVLFQPHYPRTNILGGATQQRAATAVASVALGCTGLRRHTGGNECPVFLEAQPTASTKSVSSDF
jgi:hypothetical protein